MPSVSLRRLFGATLAAAIGLVPLVPTEHVHEVEDHGRVELVIHRHSQPHGVVTEADHHGLPQTVDHPDLPILTLDQDYVVPGITRLALPAYMAVAVVSEPARFRRLGASGFVERLIHGPPRAPTLQRGPPSLLSC